MNITPQASGIARIGAAGGGLALLAGLLYINALLRQTEGVLSPPLDDTWIYLQYAERLAEGHPFSYTAGAPPSTGASSLLYLALLVPGWWVGFHGVSFAGYAIALGLAGLVATLVAAGMATKALVARSCGSTAALAAGLAAMTLLAARGHLVWAAVSGMDTILYAGWLVTIAALVAHRGAAPGIAWWMAGLLGFVRPEGIPIGFLTLLVLWFESWRERRSGQVEPDTGVRLRSGLARAGTFLGAIALLAAPALLNMALTGSPEWDSMRVKGLWSETRPDVLLRSIRELPRIWGEIAGLPFDDFQRLRIGQPIGAVGIVLLAAGFLAGWISAVAGRLGAAGRLLAGWIPISLLLGGLSPGWDSHYYRYQIPLLVPVTVLTVAGWWSWTARWSWRWAKLVPIAASLMALMVLLPGFQVMRDRYGRNGANILEQQITIGRWIEANTSADTRVAVNDAGAIAYFGRRPVLDLVGLVSHGWSPASRQGSGALFERLESLPRDSRPDLLAIYPRWFPQLAATNFAGSVVAKADLVDNTICGDRLKQVYRIDWRLAHSGDWPVQRVELIRDFGMTVVDTVDVADLASEAAHDYAWFDTFRDRLREFPSGTPQGAVAMDGGRRISRGESMRVRARPGQWLVMLMRTEGEREDTLDVAVNGRSAGTLARPRLAGSFFEPLLQIPDSLVVDSLLTITVLSRQSAASDGYSSYHYWFLQ